ncbi:hypothetical protein [Streptomyces sp. AS13]|nr:hypothetical protein [Streptomyces sp. AS13]
MSTGNRAVEKSPPGGEPASGSGGAPRPAPGDRALPPLSPIHI